jgi:hypothetical protein
MNDLDHSKFARELGSIEEHHADQRSARGLEARERALDVQFLLSSASAAYQALQAIAEQLVAAANAELKGQKFTLFNGGGPAIGFGRQLAGFTYYQPYGNVGPIVLSVRVQQQPSNFGIPDYDDRPLPEQTLRFRPVRRADKVWWTDSGDSGAVSGEDLVQAVMRALMRRASGTA